jgi:hypothetical protein
MLALKPAQYLAGGFLESGGEPRAELQAEFATAAATQLLQAEASPQELGFTVEAFRQVLPMHDGKPPPLQALDALLEALTVVARLIRQPNNEGIVTWARDCAAQVRQSGDLPALVMHMEAVLKIYALLASLPQRPSSLPS